MGPKWELYDKQEKEEVREHEIAEVSRVFEMAVRKKRGGT